MSEAFFELRISFDDRKMRDKAVEFMNGEGPPFEEEVDVSFQSLYSALEDIEFPSDIKKRSDFGLTAYFEIYGGGAMFEAQDYMEACAKGGANKIYGYYSDDDEVEIYWIYQDNEVRTLYEAFGIDEIDEILWDLDKEKRLEKVIELFEAGKI